ncbi:MAG: hypothetical protein AAB540_05020, partial [Patescibacteria group bacterium]
MKGFIGVVVLIIVALIVGGVIGWYGFYYQQQAEEQKTLSKVEDQPLAAENKMADSDDGDTNLAAKPELIPRSKSNEQAGLDGGETTVTVKTEEFGEKEDLGGLKINVKVESDVIETVDCGEESCFQQKFADCQPAIMKQDFGFMSVEYKIIGSADGGCEMVYKYLKNPNSEWANKEMTCVLDNKNKIDFQEFAGKIVVDVMNGALV